MKIHALRLILVAVGMVTACGGGGTSSDAGTTDVVDVETVAAPGIEPGAGVHVRGVAVTLGASADDVADALGAPSRVLELSAQGQRRLEWSSDGLIVVRDEAGTIGSVELLPPFAGTTGEGLALGSDRAAVGALSYGFVAEPFTGASIDRSQGIALAWDADRVVRVLVFPASPR